MKLLLITLILSGCVGLKYPVKVVEKPDFPFNGLYVGLIEGVHEVWINPHTATPCTYRHERAHAKERELGWPTHSLAKSCERR